MLGPQSIPNFILPQPFSPQDDEWAAIGNPPSHSYPTCHLDTRAKGHDRTDVLNGHCFVESGSSGLGDIRPYRHPAAHTRLTGNRGSPRLSGLPHGIGAFDDRFKKVGFTGGHSAFSELARRRSPDCPKRGGERRIGAAFRRRRTPLWGSCGSRPPEPPCRPGRDGCPPRTERGGKSTTISLFLGLLRPDTGTVGARNEPSPSGGQRASRSYVADGIGQRTATRCAGGDGPAHGAAALRESGTL